jgi:hypothetical protein
MSSLWACLLKTSDSFYPVFLTLGVHRFLISSLSSCIMAMKRFWSSLILFSPLVTGVNNPIAEIKEHFHSHLHREGHEAGQLFKHHAQAIQERDISTLINPTPISGSISTLESIVSIVTPSPGANPITVTSQGEDITSYGLYYSICPLSALSGAFSPFANVSATLTSPSALSGCSTSYTPIVTPICNTIFTGLATSISVTNCSQSVTFSTAYNYSIEASPTPYVQVITT